MSQSHSLEAPTTRVQEPVQDLGATRMQPVQEPVAPFATADVQKVNMDKWAQPLGDLNFQRAFRSEHKQWFWDSRPSILCFANGNCEN